MKGQRPVGLVVLHQHAEGNESRIEAELVDLVRNQIGPVAVFKKALFVKRLPKTRSGKIIRGVMRKIADGDTYVVPATIEDISVLRDVEKLLIKNSDEQTK